MDGLFRSRLRMQIVRDYYYNPGVCFFNTITYHEFKRLGIPLDNRQRITAYSDNMRRVAVDMVRERLARSGRARREVIESIDAVKDLHPSFTPQTPIDHYLESMRKPARFGGIWGDYFIAVFVARQLRRPIVCYNMNMISTYDH